MSDISGTGFGSSHNWRCGSTTPWKVTEYRCVNCGAFFRHAYDDVPDIFEAIRVQGLSDVCIQPPDREG
jgi:hypothetical protein